MRAAIGPDLALGVRLCGDELIEGGTTIDEAVEVARMVEAHRPGRLHQHLDRGGDGFAVHDRGVDARPARLRDVHPLGDPQGRGPARWWAWAASRTRSRPSGPSARATATSWAWSGARSRMPTSWPRPAPGEADDTRLCLSCNQECVGRMGLNRWLGCIENPRTGRESRASGCPGRWRFGSRRAGGRRRARPGLQAAIAAARNGHRVTVCEAGRGAGRPGAPGGLGSQPGRVR